MKVTSLQSKETELELTSFIINVIRKIKTNFRHSCLTCPQPRETIQHLLASHSGLRASMYLSRYDNAVAMEIYFELVKQHTKEKRPKLAKIFKTQAFEAWWNKKVNTVFRLSQDKADLGI